ncbi:SCP2 domain-containing protein [Shewanella sp. NIFS-20-20]|uniref:ubiquinone biosynthesis accessory factor UbiJ n=1 Tax=Shewanella sp. NIFS-20-20 TaxID=2853806 RepID=UPI001C47147E|nr:SCP2 sterol-binding domain-containing protein [Shewanella sp. NIFS-20-20]MBV7316840.1 SCP2 sterol-binding domain-containing protein [Shewanella sp. NIFS-20-20]
MPTEWPMLICGIVETGLQQLQAQAPHEYRRSQLPGKVIVIELAQLPFPICLICQESIHVFSDYQDQADVSLSTDIASLIALTRGDSVTDLIKQDKLVLTGDLQVLQSLSRYLQMNPPDVANALSLYIGDVPVHHLEQAGRRTVDMARTLWQASWQHMGELATEEYRIAPHRIEFIHRCDQIEALAADIDAVEQRINHLIAKVSS